MSKKTSPIATANISQDASHPTKTGFVTADKYELKVCRVCGAELTKANWYASYLKLNRYICKKCENERYDHRPFNEYRDCPLFLGIHVAERVLSHVFKNVERMPMHNPGYDFICNRGKRIDVKSACMRGNKASWAFAIHRNTTADYFLCLAFDNRTDLNPLYAWLLPGSKVQHLTAAGVSISTISKWESYRIDISKISKCCDVLKNTPKKSSTLEPDTPQKSKTDRDIPKPQKSKTDRDIPKRSTKVKQIATFQKESPNPTQDTSQQVPEEVQKRSNNKTPPITKQVQKTFEPYTTSESLTDTRDPSIKYKKGTKQDTLQNLYLSIITLLKSGIRPSKIHPKLGISKQLLQHHLTALKKQGVIHKVGYGTWEVIDSPESTKMRSTKTIYVAKNTPPSEVRQNLHMFIPDSVRAHAFLFTLQVPKGLTNWNNEKRELYLERHHIPFKTLGIIGGGQRIIINDRITHLTNKSIVIYDRSSYFAEKAVEAKSNAIHSFLSMVKKLERVLHVDLASGRDYKFRVSRQHYALVKNALAQQYNAEGIRLEVRSEADNSLWFLIDNSFNLDEAEGVHAKTGMTDTQKVQNFFNGIKETGITPAFILEAMNGIQGSQMAMAANTDSHLELINTIGNKLEELGDGVQTFNALLEKLFRKLEGGDP